MNRSSGWGFKAALTLAAACWGIGTVMSKGVLDYVPPLTLLVIQLAASLIFLWTAVLIRRRPAPVGQRIWRLGLVGWLNPGLAYTFGLLGLAVTTATMSSLIWATEPALILLLAWLLLRERLTKSLGFLSLVAISGAMLMVGSGMDTGNNGALAGNMLILAAVFCCAIYTVLTRRLVENLDPVWLTAVQQSVSLAWAIGIWLIAGWLSGQTVLLANSSAGVWLWAIVSGIVYYGLAFWFYITALKQASATLAGLFLNLIPIFGVSGAYLFLGERLAATQWAGALLILVAVVTISRSEVTRSEDQPQLERLSNHS